MNDPNLTAVPPPPAKRGFELFLDRVENLASGENVEKVMKVLRLMLRGWNLVVKFHLVPMTKDERALNDEIVGTANDLLNPK